LKDKRAQQKGLKQKKRQRGPYPGTKKGETNDEQLEGSETRPYKERFPISQLQKNNGDEKKKKGGEMGRPWVKSPRKARW